MQNAGLGIQIIARHGLGYLGLVGALVLAVSAGRASDIGGEVAPPPCSYDSTGKVVVGPSSCGGISGISVVSGSGSVLTNLAFSAPPSAGTVADPFRWVDPISATVSDLFFSGTLGPLLPLPTNPELEGNALGGRQFFSRMMSETIVNVSHSAWTGFYIELRTTMDMPSTNDDGLSFGQMSRNPQELVVAPTSLGFPSIDFESNRWDSITFTGGSIAPGTSAVLTFPISETLASSGFYLVQQPIGLTTPEPRTFLLLLTALALLICRRRGAVAGAVPETVARAEARKISVRR